MKISTGLDPQLDQLLADSEKNYDHLVPLLGRYAELLTASNTKIMAHYAPLIEAVCLLWEPEKEVIKGIRMFSVGLTNYFSAKFQAAMEPCEAAIEILKDSGHRDIYAMAHMIYGGNNRSLGEFDTAVKHLMIGVEMVDPEGFFAVFKGLGYYQLAEINVHINDYEAAERNYEITVRVSELLKNDLGLFRAYNGMANFCLSQNKLEKAKHYLNLSLSIKGLTDSQKSRSYCDLGIYYHRSQDYTHAEINLRKSYELRMEAGLKDAAATSLINLARTEIALEQPDKALTSLQNALEFCQESQSKSKIMECYHLLAKVYAKKGEWKKSSESYEKHDELQSELTTKQLQNIYNLKNGQIKKQKAVIEEAHKEITDSIKYAQRIQSAILPPMNMVQSHLKDAFILYKPKDVVAGDFYWMEHKDGKTLFAAADCTGHGVPGAMVSVVCNNALNRSVREYKLTDPGKILDKTRAIVIQEFEKSDEAVQDGMDIALCSLEGNKLQYAGAHNPLWIVRNGELMETKPNKQPIGQFDNPLPYMSHTFDLKKGDSFYIFSDGYVDQFGGEKGKKFRAKAFKELLLSIQNKKMDEQKNLLNKSFENWKGSLEQIDDVCVIGVRIS